MKRSVPLGYVMIQNKVLLNSDFKSAFFVVPVPVPCKYCHCFKAFFHEPLLKLFGYCYFKAINPDPMGVLPPSLV